MLDGAGDPVPDALVELWQADPDGASSREAGSLHRDGFTFTGWGRARHRPHRPLHVHDAAARRDHAGRRAVLRGDRVRPRPARPAVHAGLPAGRRRAALAADPLLASVDAERRATLVATADEHGFVFDIRLQGEGETVFLDPSARLTA